MVDHGEWYGEDADRERLKGQLVETMETFVKKFPRDPLLGLQRFLERMRKAINPADFCPESWERLTANLDQMLEELRQGRARLRPAGRG